jgi:hypothetical protein
MIGSCHTVPVKLGGPIRRDGRDPHAMMSMVVSSPLTAGCPGLVALRRQALAQPPRQAKSPASPPGFPISVKF